MSSFELGGFAEDPDVIDGTQEEFNAFNWCLACDYYDAILGEDFEALGEELNHLGTWIDLIDNVCNWLNYDGEIGKDIKDDLNKLLDGTIITSVCTCSFLPNQCQLWQLCPKLEW